MSAFSHFFFQIITKILVFDTWFLSASIKFGSFLRRYLKFAIAFLFICICIFLLLSGMPLLLASLKETRQEITHKRKFCFFVFVTFQLAFSVFLTCLHVAGILACEVEIAFFRCTS